MKSILNQEEIFRVLQYSTVHIGYDRGILQAKYTSFDNVDKKIDALSDRGVAYLFLTLFEKIDQKKGFGEKAEALYKYPLSPTSERSAVDYFCSNSSVFIEIMINGFDIAMSAISTCVQNRNSGPGVYYKKKSGNDLWETFEELAKEEWLHAPISLSTYVNAFV